MSGEMRRDKIYKILTEANGPVSASKLAKLFGVSRQIIVGDIALLRAAGTAVIATARGYLLKQDEDVGLLKQIVCQHGLEQTEEELNIIVQCGGQVVDVTVEHPLYGELSGRLDIASKDDVKRFVNDLKKSEAALLSQLTGGVHIHKLTCPNEEVYQNIKIKLATAGILYEGK